MKTKKVLHPTDNTVTTTVPTVPTDNTVTTTVPTDNTVPTDPTVSTIIEPEFTPTSLFPLQANTPTTIYKFQAPELTTLAHDLGAIALAANKASNGYKRDIAITCARVKVSDEIWKSEGFTGIGDFANKLFGINKVQLSSWVKVANKFYLNDRLNRNPVYTDIPISNLYEIADLTDERLEQLAASGEITVDTTQQQLRQLKTHEVKTNQEGKATVIKTYSGWIHCAPKYSHYAFTNLSKGEIEDKVAEITGSDTVEYTKSILSGKEIYKGFISSTKVYGVYYAKMDERKSKVTKKGAKTITITAEEYEALKAQIASASKKAPGTAETPEPRLSHLAEDYEDIDSFKAPEDSEGTDA